MEGEAQVATESPATESATTETQVTETAQPAEQAVETTTQPEARPSGFDPVEFTPEQKARVDRIYGNMKRYETAAKKVPELEQANEILADQIRQLHESQGKIVNHLHHEDFKSAEQQLKSDRQAAWQAGNTTAYDDANDKLRDLSVRRALTEMNGQRPQQPQPAAPPYMPKVSGEAVLERATQQGVISQDEATTYRAWMDESDNSGNAKRPWINENDPRNPAAAAIGKAVFNSPAMQNKPFGEKLREIDRLMGVQQSQANQNQNVLPSGNLTRPVKNNNVKLTEYETKIAIKTKFGGSKAKSDADHAEAYRQAKIKSQAKGGR